MFVQPRKRRCLLLQQTAPVATAQQQPHMHANTDSSEAQQQTSTSAVELAPRTQPAPLFQARGKKGHRCRTCGLQLSSASNRLRHERAKHKTSALQQSQACRPASGNSSSAAAAADADAAAEMEMDPPNSDAEGDPVSERDEADQLAAASAQVFADQVEGFRPMLQESELQTSCFPFLQWLSLPPLTSCEALVKARRVKSLAQLQPIKSNLRFIFAVLYEKELIQTIDLNDLSKLSVCQALFEALSQRNVGSGRFHAVFLLIKKVLVYLTSQESTQRRQFLQPTMHESFMYVDGICSDSSFKRKQEARNRAVLGMQATQALIKGQPQLIAPVAFQVPAVWSTSAPGPAAAGNSMTSVTPAPTALAPAPDSEALTVDHARSRSASVEASAPELTKEELQQVAKGCLSYLKSSLEAAAAAASTTNRANLDRLYMAHLVTATLCLGLAPRSQVLKQLQLGSSFVKETADGLYWVRMLADMSKNGKPTTFAIPAQLTAAFDFYIETIRPRLVGQLQLPSGEQPHNYIFVKHNGSAPRSDFSSCTNLVTQRLIGRPINAHAFRAAVVTAYYEAGASQSEMDTLASIMAHDPATARSFYYRPQFNQAALQANNKMAELLLQ